MALVGSRSMVCRAHDVPLNCCLPVADELLSAFLVRIAHRHGALATVFTAQHWPDYPIWTRDTDRWMPPDLLNRIAAHTGLEPAVLKSMTLASCIRVTGSGHRSGTIPFVNNVGVYHRARRRWGLQYCPECLHGIAVAGFRRLWRLACVTRCPVHGCDLRDACYGCHAPVILHWTVPGRLTRCPSCGTDISAVQDQDCGVHRVDAVQFSPTDRLERQLAAVLLHTPGCGPVGPWHGAEGARAIRSLIALVAGADMRERTRSLLGLPPIEQHPGQVWQLEIARLGERRILIETVAELVQDWPYRFREVASATGLTQRRFARLAVPRALAEEVGRLPPLQRHRRPWQSVVASPELRRLKRLDRGTYRQARARRLWDLVGPPVTGAKEKPQA